MAGNLGLRQFTRKLGGREARIDVICFAWRSPEVAGFPPPPGYKEGRSLQVERWALQKACGFSSVHLQGIWLLCLFSEGPRGLWLANSLATNATPCRSPLEMSLCQAVQAWLMYHPCPSTWERVVVFRAASRDEQGWWASDSRGESPSGGQHQQGPLLA